ncbi:MAG: HAMP domain-containing sensor histidine kinase [Cyclobacteriaceae bacterium]
MKDYQSLLTYRLTLVLAIFAGLLLYTLSALGPTNPQTSKSRIDSNLAREIKGQNAYIDEVSANFHLLFSDGHQDVEYPTFIFTKKKLVYWNTSKINLKFGQLAKLDRFGLATISHTKCIYQKRVVASGKEKYILVSLIPLVTQYGFNNHYLTTTTNQKIFPRQVEFSGQASEGALAIDFAGQPLFYVKVVNQTNFPAAMVGIVNAVSVILILLLIVALFQVSVGLLRKGKSKRGFLLLLFGNLILRSCLLWLEFPFRLTGMALFNSSIYVSSIASPSLGDLLLNILSALSIAAYLFAVRIRLAEEVNGFFSKRMKIVLYIFLYFLSYWGLFYFGQIILDILSNSQINLDLSQSIEFDQIRVVAFMVIVLAGLIAFLLIHTIYKIVFYERIGFLIVAAPASILAAVIGVFIDSYHLMVLVFHGIYFLIIYVNDFPSRMRKFRFGSLLYILSAIILLSGVGALSIYKGFEKNELNEKQKFATKLLIDRDIEGEYLLGQIASKIKSDMSLNSKLISPKVSVSQIKDRINQLFADGYFSGYNIRISLFDRDGLGIGKNAGLIYYDDFRRRFNSPQFKTDYENIFFEGNFLSTGRKRYVGFIELERYQNRTGYIILELNQKKQVSRSVYPELLLDNSSFGNIEFDYAVYDSKGLVHSVGEFNYKADFEPGWILSEGLFDEGMEKHGYHHLGIKADNRTIIITSRLYKTWSALSNFSFLFLLFLSVAVITIIVNSAMNYETVRSFNFSTKILIYLGCAFAIPLLLVGAAILSTLNKSYKAEIDKSFQKQTIAMGENFVELITDFYNNELNRDGLSNELLKISRSTRADINLYDMDGKLISTSQPKIIEADLLSPFINPEALYKLKTEHKDKIIIEESIGDLLYKSSFVAIRSYDDGRLLGIMSSPFFSSKNHLSRQETEVFDNIINISTLIFLISIGLSYIAVRRLTNPIMLIASKLKKTELSEDNPPLEWTSNDEIGVLVREYNSMLEKLEISRKELARNEKEAAWREMAKQVAHEIKNPLTPMKLTLQHLDRIMDKKNESRKSLSTLLSQVDTLDQIVTSFSHFARMPDPENETFDIIRALEKSINLHPDKDIRLKTSDKEALVSGDKKLFGRIFNNIILNAFQAMSSVGSPLLDITVEKEGDHVLMAFRDRGSGISEDIRDKVFVPNFSTKASGSGIGLAVAKRGITHSGGDIWFEPNKPRGTVFYIRLPLV